MINSDRLNGMWRKAGAIIFGFAPWRGIVLLAALCAISLDAGYAMPLRCFSGQCGLASAASRPVPAHRFVTIGFWRQFETPRPEGGSIASLSRTADVLHSDAGFAGVTLRCNDNGAADLVLVLLEALPPKATVNVTLGAEAGPRHYSAKVLGTGLELLLPEQFSSTSNIWRNSKELQIEIDGPQQPIHGVVELDGIQDALAQLMTKCSHR
jgi:hypothetical protein